MRVFILITICTFCLSSCRSREAHNGLLASKPLEAEEREDLKAMKQKDPGSLTERNAELAEHLRAYLWYSDRATVEVNSIYENFEDEGICKRQFESLAHILSLEMKKPRLLVRNDFPTWPLYQQTRSAFLKLVKKYDFRFESFVASQSSASTTASKIEDSLLHSSQGTSRSLALQDLELDRFEAALAGSYGQRISDGVRGGAISECSTRQIHLAQLINLHLRFPGVLQGSFVGSEEFKMRFKNISLLLENLKIQR